MVPLLIRLTELHIICVYPIFLLVEFPLILTSNLAWSGMNKGLATFTIVLSEGVHSKLLYLRYPGVGSLPETKTLEQLLHDNNREHTQVALLLAMC
jgi:hypothetical protein